MSALVFHCLKSPITVRNTFLFTEIFKAPNCVFFREITHRWQYILVPVLDISCLTFSSFVKRNEEQKDGVWKAKDRVGKGSYMMKETERKTKSRKKIWQDCTPLAPFSPHQQKRKSRHKAKVLEALEVSQQLSKSLVTALIESG